MFTDMKTRISRAAVNTPSRTWRRNANKSLSQTPCRAVTARITGSYHAYPVDADTHYIWRGRPFTTAAEMGGKRTYSRLISKHANL